MSWALATDILGLIGMMGALLILIIRMSQPAISEWLDKILDKFPIGFSVWSFSFLVLFITRKTQVVGDVPEWLSTFASLAMITSILAVALLAGLLISSWVVDRRNKTPWNEAFKPNPSIISRLCNATRFAVIALSSVSSRNKETPIFHGSERQAQEVVKKRRQFVYEREPVATA
jgi:hypothetical protein